MFAIIGHNFPADLNIRNGDIALIQPATRSAAIPAHYFWPTVPIPATHAAASWTILTIREEFGRIGAATRARPSAAAGVTTNPTGRGFETTAAGQEHQIGTLADWQPTVDANNTDANLRLEAIALGAARTGIRAYWRIDQTSVAATEASANEVFTVRVDQSGEPTAIRLPAGVTDANGNITLETVLAMNMTDLSEMEQEFAFMCFSFGAAAYVLAGCELLESGHHYLTSNIKPTRAVERQMLGAVSDAVKAAWNGHLTTLRDIVWHKTIHPLMSNDMRAMASNADVPAKLDKAGLGSVAVRLPYTGGALRGAKAMYAVFRAVTVVCAEAGYVVEMPKLANAITYMETFDDANPLETETGITPVDSYAAISDYLRPVMADAEPFIAWCAGMLKGVNEDAEDTTTNNTLLAAKSVEKAMKNHIASVGLGRNSYVNYKRFVRANIEKGNLPAVNMVFEHK